MQSIISLLDKKKKINNQIWRLQKTQQTITEQVKDYVDNLSPEKKRFLDDKILSTFDEKTIEHIKAYRKYIKDLSDGVCNCYQDWSNIFDPYMDKYTIDQIIVNNKANEWILVKVTVVPEKSNYYISSTTLHNLYTTDWFNIEEFEKCD